MQRQIKFQIKKKSFAKPSSSSTATEHGLDYYIERPNAKGSKAQHPKETPELNACKHTEMQNYIHTDEHIYIRIDMHT